jgi:hypothetical protein
VLHGVLEPARAVVLQELHLEVQGRVPTADLDLPGIVLHRVAPAPTRLGHALHLRHLAHEVGEAGPDRPVVLPGLHRLRGAASLLVLQDEGEKKVACPDLSPLPVARLRPHAATLEGGSLGAEGHAETGADALQGPEGAILHGRGDPEGALGEAVERRLLLGRPGVGHQVGEVVVVQGHQAGHLRALQGPCHRSRVGLAFGKPDHAEGDLPEPHDVEFQVARGGHAPQGLDDEAHPVDVAAGRA